MIRTPLHAAALGAALLLSASLSHAALGVVDPIGDFLPTFTGQHGADLDVVSTFATYNASTNIFHISGTFAGAVGTTTGALYVFGFDRGAGTERFAAAGYPGVVFDSVVSLNPFNLAASSITLMAPAGNTTSLLSASAITISGNSISADFSASLLPTTGMAAAKYTYNLWPRDTTAIGGGVTPISDFAPDGSNITIAAVPEPETYALFGAGLGVIALLRRRRSNTSA